jgi:hypothetical protein
LFLGTLLHSTGKALDWGTVVIVGRLQLRPSLWSDGPIIGRGGGVAGLGSDLCSRCGRRATSCLPPVVVTASCLMLVACRCHVLSCPSTSSRRLLLCRHCRAVSYLITSFVVVVIVAAALCLVTVIVATACDVVVPPHTLLSTPFPSPSIPSTSTLRQDSTPLSPGYFHLTRRRSRRATTYLVSVIIIPYRLPHRCHPCFALSCLLTVVVARPNLSPLMPKVGG